MMMMMMVAKIKQLTEKRSVKSTTPLPYLWLWMALPSDVAQIGQATSGPCENSTMTRKRSSNSETGALSAAQVQTLNCQSEHSTAIAIILAELGRWATELVPPKMSQ